MNNYFEKMILLAFFVCFFTCGKCCDNPLTEQVLKRLDQLEGELSQLKEKYDKMQMEKLGLKEDITSSETIKSQRRTVDSSDTNIDGGIGFYARITSGGMLGVHQTLEFDHVHENSGNGYQPLHGHFTAPIAGLYYFTTTIYSYDNKGINCEMVKNGINIGKLFAPLPGLASSTMSAVIRLNVGDMVWIRHLGTTPQELNGGDYSHFAGFLIAQ